MIDIKQLSLKNPQLEQLFERDAKITEIRQKKGEQEAVRYLGRLPVQEIGESIIGGYLGSLFDKGLADDTKSLIDFTYSTLANVSPALFNLYRFQKNSYPEDRNRLVTAKTLAAVLYGLAMNEHGCALRVTHGKKEPFWGSDLSIKLGTKREIDFLKPAMDSISNSPIEVENGVMIMADPFIRAYKSAIGINLAEKGLGNILLT